MKISDLLDKNTIELNLKPKKKEEVFRELVDILYRAKKIKNPQKSLDFEAEILYILRY